ncbi:hypothetical protein [Endozoicomonas atrinae]|uniref:hypothetical protein n=1 Tax=Endozoicomonas atrinae TaxID=1333660 RepID=UPI003AFF70B1
MDGPGKPTPSSDSNFQPTESKKQKYGSHNSKKTESVEGKKYAPRPPEGRRPHDLPEYRKRQIKTIDPESGYGSDRSSTPSSPTEASDVDWNLSESEPDKGRQRITDHIAMLGDKNGISSDPDYVYKFAHSLAKSTAKKAEYFPEKYNQGLEKHIASPHDITQKFFLRHLTTFMEEKGVQFFTNCTNRLIKRQISDGLIDDIGKVLDDSDGQPSNSKSTRYFDKVESLLQQSLEYEFNQGRITPDTIILTVEILAMLKTDNLNQLSELLEQYRVD